MFLDITRVEPVRKIPFPKKERPSMRLLPLMQPRTCSKRLMPKTYPTTACCLSHWGNQLTHSHRGMHDVNSFCRCPACHRNMLIDGQMLGLCFLHNTSGQTTNLKPHLSKEKNWLFRVYRGLYPVMWGL